MQHKIRLTADWTNPEAGTDHKAGEIVTVPSYMLRRKEHYGLLGKFTVNLDATHEKQEAIPTQKQYRKALPADATPPGDESE